MRFGELICVSGDGEVKARAGAQPSLDEAICERSLREENGAELAELHFLLGRCKYKTHL